MKESFPKLDQLKDINILKGYIVQYHKELEVKSIIKLKLYFSQ